MLSVCGDHATVHCHSVDPTPPFDVTAPGYSLRTAFSVYMDCCCILYAPCGRVTNIPLTFDFKGLMIFLECGPMVPVWNT